MGPRTICVFSQKGGVGKTTTAMALAEAFHKSGDQVTLLDTDPQGSANKWEKRLVAGFQRFPVAVQHLSEGYNDGPTFAKRVLETIQPIGSLDYLIIDTPPYITGNVQMRAALEFAELALIPLEPHISNIDALEELAVVVQEIQAKRAMKGRPPLKVYSIANKVGSRRASEKQFLELLPTMSQKPRYSDFKALNTHVKNAAAIADAWNYRTSIFGMPGSKEVRATLTDLVVEIKEVLEA